MLAKGKYERHKTPSNWGGLDGWIGMVSRLGRADHDDQVKRT